MKAPQSRLLARLDGALARTRHPVEAACLRAERAGFLARLGHLDAARAAAQALHAQFDTQPHAAVSSWLCLVDGWVLHAEAGGAGLVIMCGTGPTPSRSASSRSRTSPRARSPA